MDTYLGQLLLVPYDFVPKGWFACDGSLLPVKDYEALASLLGSTFGGDGVQTFALPDLRGRVPVGAGPATPFGSAGGAESVALDASTMPAHRHPVLAATSDGNTKNPAGAALAAGALIYAAALAPVPLAEASGASSGAGAPHNNLQPFLALQWIISAEGAYPTNN